MRYRMFSVIWVVLLFLGVPATMKASQASIEMADRELQDITVKYHAGVLHLTGANGMMVTIFNIAGMAIKSFRVEGQDKRISLTLTDGIYLVKIGNVTTRKILIKN